MSNFNFNRVCSLVLDIHLETFMKYIILILLEVDIIV